MKFTRLKSKDDFLLNIMTLQIWKGNTHYNQCWINNNTRNGSASQMGELFRECLFNLGIMTTSSLIQVHQDHILFHGLFGLYDLLGLHQCLKAQLITAFIRDIFIFIRSAIFGYSIFLTISFLDLFLYPSRGILAFHCSFPFLHMLRNTVLQFSFSMGAYSIFQYKQYMSFQFQPTTSQVTRGSSAQCQTSGQPTRMIQAYNPTYQGKFCHQLRAETQYKQGGLSNKSSSRENNPPCQKSRSQSG